MKISTVLLFLSFLAVVMGGYKVANRHFAAQYVDPSCQKYATDVILLKSYYAQVRALVDKDARIEWFANQSLLPYPLPEGVTDHRMSENGTIKIVHEDFILYFKPFFEDIELRQGENHDALQWVWYCR